ncbi:hypothetical protein B9Z39_02810 [Limnohabitans sp. JirII-29]|uniref:site-specific integrase n=1 Tax=Limnohabitans sp. JirII-29 TaxID=1835756 RepID=UPI000D3D18DF|nr:site-specific integrase [Limnohabitans sp. JirII-29]PUE29025.1 hypothetical protein B9Z39_02810 [Limnohabitans sp. JirII-29]
MATVRQRGDRWQVIVKRKGYPTRSNTFDLKKDAEKWGRQQERLMDTGDWSDTAPAKNTTLEQLLERYLVEVTVHKPGAYVEASRIKTIKQASLAKYSLAAVCAPLITAWRDSRLKQVSGSTVAKEMGLLSHVFSVAIKEWGVALPANPISMVRKPAQPASRDRTLNDSERQALIDACGACRNPWIKPVVVFALETAARRGEILNLRWTDVSLDRCTAKLDGKTGSRVIPLSPTCVELLRGLPRSLDGMVFPVTVETLKQAYERAVLRAGIKDFTFHDLRHDALTRLAKLGLSVLELRAISGHTTANMLQRYVSIDPGELASKLWARA